MILKPKSKEEIWKHLTNLCIDDILVKSIFYGFKEGVVYAVENGVNIDLNEGEPLGIAITYNHIKIAQYLLEQGAYPNFIEKN